MAANKKTKQYLTRAVVAGLLFVVLAVYVHTTGLSELDETMFRFIYSLPIGWKMAMVLVTTFGSSWMVVGMTLMLYLMKKTRLASYVLFIGLVTYGASEFSKYLVGRPRPFTLLHDIVAREPFVSGMGFPSGHTAVATAVGLIVVPYVPKQWRRLVPGVVLSVAISRMYLGVHTPLDVVGGALLGVVTSQVFWLSRPSIRKWFRRVK